MNGSWDAATAEFEPLDDVPWREACYVVALNRLARAYSERVVSIV